MIVIGLTGGIASGKSTVAAMLEKKGARLIDADSLAREAVEPGQPAWQEIVDWLGPSILLPDRSLDRIKLGNLVFSDKKMLARLNKIVHPWVGGRFLSRAEEIKKREPKAALVYDIPLLLEAGMQESVDIILLVYATRAVQLRRLMERSGLCETDAARRLAAQMPLEEKKKHAHYVIDNGGNLEDTAAQVDRLWAVLEQKYGPF